MSPRIYYLIVILCMFTAIPLVLNASSALSWLALGALIVIGVLANIMGDRARSAEEAEVRRVLREGTPARATILALSARSGAESGHVLVDLDLAVRPSGTEPFRAMVQALISILDIPRIQPGCELEVKIDRANPRRLLIDPALGLTGPHPGAV